MTRREIVEEALRRIGVEKDVESYEFCDFIGCDNCPCYGNGEACEDMLEFWLGDEVNYDET